jgi:hypothetical protein
MELATNFVFQPLDNDEGPAPTAVAPAQGLGPLAGLAGNWSGPGFNAIWRPHRGASDHFLELNVTNDQIDLAVINGNIPNRGLVQANIFMHGMTYLQQISDANVQVNGVPAGLHIEPGVWINVPVTTDPKEPATIARLASIPHGTTILLQGTATTGAGGPSITAASLTPFSIGNRHQTVDFDEQHLNRNTQFRTSGVGLTGITQAMLNNPNSVLTKNPPNVTTTTTLHVSSTAGTAAGSIVGGGMANSAFLVGTKDGPNADAAHAAATFWLQTLAGDTEPKRLQYSQTVLLNFAGLSWPHITVATLTKA